MLARFASGARVFSRRAVTPVVARRAASPVVFRKQWMSTSKEDLLLVEEEVTIAMEDVDFVENLKRLPAVLKKKRSKVIAITDTAGKEYHILLPSASEIQYEVEFEQDEEECELEFSIKWKLNPKISTKPRYRDYSTPKAPSPVEDIEGVGPKHAATLREHGISTTNQLLEKVKAEGAEAVAKSTAISEDTVVKFCQIADLMQIKGISSQSSELLHLAGVKSSAALASADPEQLLAACKQVMERRPTLNKILLGIKWATNMVSHADAFVKAHAGK